MAGRLPYSGHGQVLVALALSLFPWACSNDPNTLFARADAGSRAAPERRDILSLYADLGQGGACAACLEAECSDEERACLGDPDCTEQAMCKARCRDPQCAMHCPRGAEGTSLADLTLAADAVLTPDACRRKRCVGPCAVGRSLDCRGDFEWNQVASPFGRVEVVAVPPAIEQPWSETTVTFCRGEAQTCDGDAMPFEALGDTLAGVSTVDTLGLSRASFFELRAPNAYPELWYPLFDPSADEPAVLIGVLTRDLVDIAGPVFDDPAVDGFVVLTALDCMVDEALGIQFGVEPAPTRDDATFWYGLGGVDGDRTTSGGLGGVTHVEPGRVAVRVTLAETGEIIARRNVWVVAGAVTQADMTPLSRSEPP